MKLKCALAVAVVAILSGCAVLLPPATVINFTGTKGDFSVVKTGCVLESGRFTDKSGRGNPYPLVKFIAVTNSGQTVGQWTAICEAVVPNGTSNCRISGPKKAAFECSNYDQFMIAN